MHLHRQVLPRPERTAHPGQRQPDLVLGQPQGAGHLPAVDVQPLGGDVQVDAPVLARHRQPGFGPKERLVLHPDLVVAMYDDLGGGCVRVAEADPLMPHDVALGMHGRLVPAHRRTFPRLVVHRFPVRMPDGLAGVAQRLNDLVVHDDQRRRPPSGLRMIRGHDRDRLTLVADLVVGEHRLIGDLQPVDLLPRYVVVREHGGHPGNFQCGADVDRGDPGTRMGAAQGGAPEHAVHVEVGAVRELAGDLEPPVRPERRLPDTTGRRGPDLGRYVRHMPTSSSDRRAVRAAAPSASTSAVTSSPSATTVRPSTSSRRSGAGGPITSAVTGSSAMSA